MTLFQNLMAHNSRESSWDMFLATRSDFPSRHTVTKRNRSLTGKPGAKPSMLRFTMDPLKLRYP